MPQPHSIGNYTRTAGYVDRLPKDAMPADLPVQAPIKYRLVINLKAAKALGLGASASLLAHAMSCSSDDALCGRNCTLQSNSLSSTLAVFDRANTPLFRAFPM